jgi:hypothetical protein
MAKIVLSDLAPAEQVHFSFSGVEFDLSGKKTYESDDSSVLTNAEVHPWLDVKYEAADVVQGEFHDQLAPEDDPFSSKGGSKANDPEAARIELESRWDLQDHTDEPVRVAIDAGLMQTEVVVTGGVAETLAADPESKTSDKVKN